MRIFRLNKKAESGIRLWLDDERDPKDPYIKHGFYSKGDEVWVKTPAEAINHLSQGKVSFISLDHDLGLDSSGESGMTVAKWIEAAAYNGELKRLEWDVHSQNPVGRKAIQQAMNNAERFWDEKDLENQTVQ